MIGYIMVGTRNLDKALAFYSPLFAAMGWKVYWKGDSHCSFGEAKDPNAPHFIVGYPFDGKPASMGNGTMTAFRFDDTEMVDRLYEMALELGGSSEGKPGYRPQYGEGF